MALVVARDLAARVAFADVRRASRHIEATPRRVRHHLVRGNRRDLARVEVVDAPTLVAVLERVLLARPPMIPMRRSAGSVELASRFPYPKLPTSAFTSVAERVHDKGALTRFVESRTNLKKGRGRVRRIAVLADEGRHGLREAGRPARPLSPFTRSPSR